MAPTRRPQRDDRRGITARIGIESSERLGRHRWSIERIQGWLLFCKRLALRYDRSEATITAPRPDWPSPSSAPVAY